MSTPKSSKATLCTAVQKVAHYCHAFLILAFGTHLDMHLFVKEGTVLLTVIVKASDIDEEEGFESKERKQRQKCCLCVLSYTHRSDQLVCRHWMTSFLGRSHWRQTRSIATTKAILWCLLDASWGEQCRCVNTALKWTQTMLIIKERNVMRKIWRGRHHNCRW